MAPTPKPWRISVPILLVLLFGGGFAGEQLAGVLTSDSALARFIGFLALPTSIVLGFISWLGAASFIALKRGIKRKSGQPGVQREEDAWRQTTIPSGSKAFVIASVLPCVIAGALVGMLSTEYGFALSFLSYIGIGIVYGLLCWKAAENGYLQFPTE